MKNCSQCGANGDPQNKFCLNCGAKHETNLEVSSPKENRKPETAPKQRHKKLGVFLSIMVLLLLLAGSHIFMQSKYDASKKILEMDQAYSRSEPEKFLSLYLIDDDVISDAESFYAFVEEEDWGKIRSQLQAEVEHLESEGLSNVIQDSAGNKFITAVYEPVLFGLYKEISFLVHPIKVEATSSLDKTSIELDEKEVIGQQDEKLEIGKFLPGNYDWKASAESVYSPIENGGTAVIRGNGSNLYELDLELEAGMITITSDLADAVLWINGKSTGKTITEMNPLGPVPFDGTVEISAESKDDDDATVKGDTVSIESDTAHIRFDVVQEKMAAEKSKEQQTEKLQELIDTHEMMLHDLISSFRHEFESALNYGDFSYISSFFPSSSKIQAEYINKMDDHYNREEFYYYDFETTTVTDIRAIDLTTIQVDTDEVFDYTLGEVDYKYRKTKRYTVDVQSGYYITDIQELSSDMEEQ